MRGKKILHVLGDTCGDAAPLSETLPDLHGIGRRLLLFQKQVELVHIVAGGLSGFSVGSDTAPYLVLDDQHAQLLQLLAELLDVVADQAVIDVHVGPVVEQIQGAFDVDLKRRCHMMGFFFFLFQKSVIQILQKRHVLRDGILEVLLVDLMDTAVNNRFFDGLQAFLSADNEFTERQYEVRFQRDRVILLRVVQVDVHRVDVLGAGRADMNDLAVEALHESRVLSLRIADDHIVIRHQEGIGNLTLGAEGFTGTGGTENQAVRVLQGLPVHHDQVV